jgi:sugar/nucleoside kinase (ribokinase family)
VSRAVTAGETMALLDPVADGELALGDLLRLRIAGAESNFAIGLARLGVEVAWISRLGAAEVVDEVGAGDAFAAGFAYGLLQGWEPAGCAHAGHVIAGWALRGTGDWETLPRLEEVRALLGGP